MDWNELSHSAISADDLKRRLSIVYVLDHYNIEVFDDNGRVTALCPFHNDTNPSFDVFEFNGKPRVGCFPCSKQGDVLDLIGWLENCEFPAAMNKAVTLLQLQEKSNYIAPPLAPQKAPIDPEAISEILASALVSNQRPLEEMIRTKKWPVDRDWLQEVFYVGCIDNDVIIPYQDAFGSWSGYKIRSGKEKLAAPGSRFPAMYASWLDQGRPSVIITEGEPDTWATMFAVGSRYDVLGLSTGAGSKVQETPFRNRHVILAFDGDEAGRIATKTWALGLKDVAATIRIIPMPDGYDMCMLPDIAKAVEEAKPLLQYTGNVEVIDGLFVRRNGEKTSFINNWGFEPTKELIDPDGGVAYEGHILPSRKLDVITGDDLASGTKALTWAADRGLGWRGSDTDARDILIWLESQGPFLSPGKMTRVLGLHDNHFVLPHETIGKDRWTYVPNRGMQTGTLDFIQRSGWQAVLYDLLQLHTDEVIHPILAWLAAAPIRSLLDEFPVLAISGSSGAGKTTLIKTMTRAFSGGTIGGKDGISLANTTPHAITDASGASNAFPLWFDEYRASIKYDTRTALHNTLLAAYIGQTSTKGTVSDHGLGVRTYEHVAPIIISGENTFAETAHVERMVQVSIGQAGRNPTALARVQDRIPSGLATAFLSWLIYHVDLEELVVKPSLTSLPSRVNQNLGVLNLGWSLLDTFMVEHRLTDLPRPNFSLVVKEATESVNDDPVLDAIRWAVETPPGYSETIAIVDGEFVLVRVTALVEACRNRFPLPGGAKAIHRLLLEKYHGTEIVEKYPLYNLPNRTRFIKLRMDVVNGEA